MHGLITCIIIILYKCSRYRTKTVKNQNEKFLSGQLGFSVGGMSEQCDTVSTA